MRAALIFLLLLFLLPFSLVLQDLLPALPPLQERVFLLPVVFCFGALALPLIPALFFGLAAALVQGLAVISVQSGNMEFGFTAPVVFFLSWTILFQMINEATKGMRWEFHALGSALVTLTMLGGEFLILCIKRGGFPVDEVVFFRLLVPSAFALLIAPLIYLLLILLIPYEKPFAALGGRPSFGNKGGLDA